MGPQPTPKRLLDQVRDARAQVVSDLDQIPLGSSCEERKTWVNCAMERLHAHTAEEQRFDILSR